MNRFVKLFVVLVAAMWVSGCSWLRGEDNAEPPTELTDIQPRANLVKLWDRDIGAARRCPIHRDPPARRDVALDANRMRPTRHNVACDRDRAVQISSGGHLAT